jgi:glycolate oxidase
METIDPELRQQLISLFGADNCLFEIEDLVAYSYDSARDEHRPAAVVFAQNAPQIAALMQLANRKRFAVVPRGAGSGLSGGSVPLAGGVVLVTTAMRRILEVSTDDLYAVVEPGVITADLINTVARHKLLYPPDPSSMKTSTLAGNIAENAGGLRGLKYGVTKDYVMALEVVTPTGEIIKTGAKTVKSVSGYDLTKLFVGSEGTLGVITQATLRLIPAPAFRRSLIAVFDDIALAGRTVADVIKSGVIPATMEIMDHITLQAVENFKHIGLPQDADAVLLLETDGIEAAAVQEAATIERICRGNRTIDVKIAASESERDQVWEARRSALAALARIKPTVILEDATVPRSKIPDMIAAVQDIAQRHRLVIGTFGHAGDGNLHPTIITDERNTAEMQRVEAAVAEIFDAALRLGGTLSGEHGIGLAKKMFLHKEFGLEGVETMRRIKKALDPNNVLNPGKLFD